MAKQLTLTSFCDPCKRRGLDHVPAPHTHKVQIDNGPVKELDFCDPCRFHLIGGLLDVYEHEGQEPPSQQKQERLVRKAKGVGRSKPPRELSAVPDPNDEPGTIWLVCPLSQDHRSKKPEHVQYKYRAGHAEHHGLKVWEIEWADPERKLTDACTAHQECIDHNLRFKNPIAVVRHVASADLKRIDK